MPLRAIVRRLLILAAGLVLLLAIVAAVVAVARTRDGAGGVRQSAEGPVLLVSGYGGDAQGMSAIAAALDARGRHAVIVPAVPGPTGGNTGDITAQAQHLNQVVQAQLASGAPSVDVVGHSQGGVVARVWANEYGRGVARRIVTLGSPHHGTDVALAAAAAGAACPIACQQLVPGSSLLADLPETPGGARYVSIFTADDQTVVPVSTSRLQGAVNIETQDVCAGSRVSHSGLTHDPLTIGLVELALDGPPLASEPGPGQCAALRRAG